MTQTLRTSNPGGTMLVMVSRSEAVAQSLASARLEGMEPPAETLAVTQAWARGDLSDADLDAYAAGELAAAREVASAGRAATAAA